MREADANNVRHLPLFRDMADQPFDALMSAAMLQRLPTQLELIREGDRADFLHVMVEGKVELYSHRENDELGFMLMGPNTTFILAAVALDRPYLNSARTLSASQILMIPASSVRTAINADLGFSRAIVLELSLRYRTVLKELKNRKFRPTLERLANFILREMEREGDTGRFLLPFDKRKLAAHIGTTPENLSRILASLNDHQVSVKGRDIAVGSIIALTALAKPDPLIDEAEVL